MSALPGPGTRVGTRPPFSASPPKRNRSAPCRFPEAGSAQLASLNQLLDELSLTTPDAQIVTLAGAITTDARLVSWVSVRLAPLSARVQWTSDT